MTRFPRSSIGQLLGVGFGLLFLLLGVLGAAVYVWHSDSAAAQRDFLERISPLAEEADHLERALLQFAIVGRSYLLSPSQDVMNRFRQARKDVEETVAQLQRAPNEPDKDALVQQISTTMQPYLIEADRLISRHVTAPVDILEERGLSDMRERVTQTVRRLADLQRGKTATAMATMQAARDRVSTGIAAAILIGGLLAGAIAWVTAQSVRRPASELVSIAASLEAGDWQPALQLVKGAPGEDPDSHGEMRRLAHAIGSAAVALEQREQQLQAQNEELQAQNEEIQAQSEELQAQHEEIQSQNGQLVRQAEELIEADRRKDRFLGVLAHELRNPMAPISNSLALLKRSPPGSEHSLRAQAMIERQARHLIRLIDDLLDVTRISQGKIRLQLEELDFAEVVRACIEDQQASLSTDERSFSLKAPEGRVRLNGDRTRLSQIVGNLLNNAVKFTDRGGRITLELQSDASQRQASLHVSDDGVGIDQQLLPDLFQPFTQGAMSLDRTHTGLGLGLSLVRALVELHGGTIVAGSEGPGRGSQFRVTLPLAV